MNAEEEMGIKCQVLTLPLVREVCRKYKYKAANYKTVAEQYGKARAAYEKCKTFELLLESEVLP